MTSGQAKMSTKSEEPIPTCVFDSSGVTVATTPFGSACEFSFPTVVRHSHQKTLKHPLHYVPPIQFQLIAFRVLWQSVTGLNHHHVTLFISFFFFNSTVTFLYLLQPSPLNSQRYNILYYSPLPQENIEGRLIMIFCSLY